MLSNVSWVAPAGGNWATAADWSTGTVPGSGDTAIIGTLNPGAQVTYNTGASTVAALQDSGLLTITGGTLAVSGSTIVTGTTLTLDGGTLADTTLSMAIGGVIQTAAGSMSTLDAATLGSNFTIVSGSTLDVADGLTFQNNATITVDAGGTLNFVDGTSNTQTMSGSGSIVLAAASGSYTAAQINANGASAGSSVTFANGVNITGEGTAIAPNVITASTGNTIIFDNSVTNAVVFATSGGYLQGGTSGRIQTTFTGVTIAGNLEVAASCDLNIASGVAITNSAKITVSDGSYFAFIGPANFSQSVTGNGTFVLGDATGDGRLVDNVSGGQVTLGAGITVRGVGPGFVYLVTGDGGQFTNDGTITDTTAGSTVGLAGNGTFVNNGVINVGPGGFNGGNITLTATSQVSVAGGWIGLSGAFSNAGLIYITNNGTAFIGSSGQAWVNTGQINFTGQELDIGGVAATSSFQGITYGGKEVFLGGTIENAGQTFTFPSTTSWWGSLGYTIVGGTVAFAPGAFMVGGYELDGVALASGLTLNSGNLTVVDGLTLENGATITVPQRLALSFIDGTSNTQTVSGSGSIVLDAASGTYATAQINISGANAGSAVTFGNGVDVTGQGIPTAPNTITAAAGNTIVFDNSLTNVTLSAASGGYLQSDGGYSAPTVLSGVTIASNFTLGTGSTLDVQNGLTLANSATVFDNSGSTLGFESGLTAGQTLGGAGTLQLWNDVTGQSGLLFDYDSTGALTIGSGITVEGAGVIGGSGTLANQGTLNASAVGQTLDLGVGGLNWGNTGTINIDGGTLNLGGNFTTAGLGSLNYSSGQVEISGIINNVGSTLVAAPLTTGPVLRVLNGAAINGGSVAIAAGSVIQAAADAAGAFIPVSNWADVNVGGPIAGAQAAYNAASNSWLVAGGGAGIGSIVDQFNYVYQSATGDTTIAGQVQSAGGYTGDQAGLMYRNSTSAGAAFAAVEYSGGGTVAFQWRSSDGGSTSQAALTGIAGPIWLKVVRTGNEFSAFYSSDNTTWTQIGSAQTVNLTPTALAGLLSSSNAANQTATANLSNVSVTPNGWADVNIGGPAVAGGGSLNSGGVWTINGGGTGVGGSGDQLNYTYQYLNGDGDVVALIQSISATNAAATAGIMFRDSADPGAMVAAVFENASGQITFDWRTSTGGTTSSAQTDGVGLPVWVRLLRQGNVFTALYSTNGQTWFEIGSPQTIAMSANALAGLAAASGDNSTLNASNFAYVGVGTPAAPSGLAATAASSTVVGLAWQNNSPDQTFTTIQQSTDGIDFTTVGTAQAGQSTFTISGLSPATAYTFRVAASDTLGSSACSNVAAVTTLAAPAGPAVPTSLTATATSDSQVELSWLNGVGYSGVDIEESLAGGAFVPVGSVSGNVAALTVMGLSPETAYVFRVQAFNANGESPYSATATATTPAAASPITLGSPTYTATIGQTLTVSAADGLLQGASGPSGSTLTIVGGIALGNGSVSVNADGSFQLTDYAQTPVDSFTYIVSDGLGDTAIGVATVNLRSGAGPVLGSPQFDLVHDTTLTITNPGLGLLAGATDPNGEPLTTGVMVGGVFQTATGAITTSHGEITLNGDGTFTYTPDAGFVGTDSFNYAATDGTYTTGQSVSFVVGNATPTLGTPTYVASTGQPLAVSAANGLLAGISDPDGDALTVVPAAAPANGSVIIAADGSFTYTPNAGFSGVDSFGYGVSDGISTVYATATINASEALPTAINHTYSLQAGSPLSVSAATGLLSGSADPLAAALSVAGTTPGSPLILDTAGGSVTINSDGSFAYTPNAGFTGADSFTYALTDGASASTAATVTLDISDTAPQVANSTYSLASGQTLAVSAADGVLANAVDFNPVSGLQASLVSGPSDGTLTFNSDGSFTYAPNSGFSGSDQFTYRASDGTLASNVATVSMDVQTSVPFGPTLSYNLVHDKALAVDAANGLLADTISPSGAALTIVGTTSGSPLTIATADGSVSINADGSFVYTPAWHYVGSDSFTYTVSDGVALSAPISVELAVTNTPPVAANYSYTIAEDAVLTVTSPGVLTGISDADGDLLTVSVANGPSDGTLSLNAGGGSGTGSFTYTPGSGFSGTDSFTYNVSDGVSTATGLVTVTVVAPLEPPVATAPSYSTYTGQPLNVTLGGLLSQASDPQNLPMQVNLLASTTHGTLTLNADGTFLYAPAPGYTGADSFVYTVSDGANGANPSAALTATISVISSVPVAGDGTLSVAENQTLTVPATAGLLAISSDPNGDALAAELAANAAHGTVAVNSDGSFTYTPAANFTGTDSFGFTVSDGSIVSAVGVITIHVVSGGIVTNGLTYQAQQGQPLTVSAKLGILRDDWANDGGTLAVGSVNGTAVAATGDTAISTTDGELLVAADGSFTYTPSAGFTGTDSFTYQAQEGTAYTSAAVTVTLNIVNTSPVAQNQTYSVLQDKTLNIAGAQGLLVGAYDTDGDALSVYGGPASFSTAHGSVTLGSDGSFHYTPVAGFVGTDTFAYSVTDGASASSTASVTINVTDQPPVGVNQQYRVLHDATSPLTGDVFTGAYDPVGGTFTAVLQNPASPVAHGTLTFDGGSGQFSYLPTAGYSGPDGFTFVLTDGLESSQPISVSIDVWNSVPVANPLSYTVAAGANPQLPGTANVLTGVSDPDGDTLTAGFYMNGVFQTGTQTVNLPIGSVKLNSISNGSLVFNGNADVAGTGTVYFGISDGAAVTAPTAITIDVVDTPPLAVDEFFSTADSATASGNLLDPVAAAGPGLTSRAQLVGGATSITTANSGTVTLTTSGGFTYAAKPGFTGMDSFSYQVCDGVTNISTGQLDWGNSATVTIDVTKSPPITAAAYFSGAVGTPITGNVTGTDTDTATLTVTSVNGTAVGDSGNTTIASTDGSLSIASSGAFTFTPLAGFTGTYNFSYVATDGWYTTGPVNVSISINGGAATAQAATLSTPEGTPLTANLITSAVNTINDTAVLAQINGVAIGGISASNPVKTPNGQITMADASGTFTYLPNAMFYGADSFSYTITDLEGQPASGAIDINVTAQAPVASATTFTVGENQVLTIPVAGLLPANDPNVGAASTSVAVASGPAQGTLSAVTGAAGESWTYTPDKNYSGTDSFYFTVTDTLGLTSAPVQATIDVSPAVATITAGNGTLGLLENGSASINVMTLVTSSVPGAMNTTGVTLAIATAPKDGNAVVSGTTITYTPDSNYFNTATTPDSLVYQATLSGQTSTGTLTLLVSQVELPPVVLANVALGTSENSTTGVGYAIPTPVLDTSGISDSSIHVDISSAPANGTAYATGNGFTYVPNPGFSGTDSFAYTVYDGAWQSAAGTATVTVTPSGSTAPPQAAPAYQSVGPVATNTSGDVKSKGGGSYVFGGDGGGVTLSSDGENISVYVSSSAGSSGTLSVIVEGGNVYVSSSTASSASVSAGAYPLAGGPPTSANLYWQGGAQSLSIYTNMNVGSISVPGSLTISAGQNYFYPSVGGYGGYGFGGPSAAGAANLGNLSAGGYLQVNTTGSTGDLTAGGNMNVYAGGNIGAINVGGILYATASGNISNITAGSTDNITAGGSIGNISVAANMDSSYGTQTVSTGGNLGSVSAGGYIHGNIDVGGNITGTVSAAGDISGVNVTGDISGAVTSTGSTIDSINCGNLDGSLNAAQNINGINAVNISGSITAGGAIDELVASDNLGGSISARSIGTIMDTLGSIDASIASQSTIYRVQANAGSIGGTITASGQIGYVSQYISAVGISAYDDISATVHGGADMVVLSAGRDISGKIIVVGQVSNLYVGRDLTATGSVTAEYLYNVSLGRNLAGTLDATSSINNSYFNVHAVGITGTIESGSTINSVVAGYNDPRLSGFIAGATILAADSIGSITVTAAPGYPGGITNTNISAGSGGIGWISASGAISNITVSTTGNIGGAANEGYPPALSSGDQTAMTSSDISGTISAASITTITATGSINAAITATGTIGGVTAAQNVGGTITAADTISAVTADHGSITAAITSTQMSIDQVTAGGNISGALAAHINIGAWVNAGWYVNSLTGVTAGGNVSGDIIATLGSVSFVTAGTNGGGNISGNITAGEDIGAVTANASMAINTAVNPGPGATPLAALSNPQPDNGSLPPTPTLAPLVAPPTSTAAMLGAISGTIRAGGTIASVTAAGGGIAQSITAGQTLGNVWALGDIDGAITSGVGNVVINTWGQLLGNVSGTAAITANAYGNLSGSVTSAAGAIFAASWAELSGALNAVADVTAWAGPGGGISSNLTVGGLAEEYSWGTLGGSVAAATGTSGTSPPSLIASAIGSLSTNITGGVEDLAMFAWSSLNMPAVTVDGYGFGFSYGNLSVASGFSAPNGSQFVTGEDFSGTFSGGGNIIISALGSVTATITTSANPAKQGSIIDISGDNISGSITAGNQYGTQINLDAQGDESVTVGEQSGTGVPINSLSIRDGGTLSGSIDITGVADVVSEGAVNATIVAGRGAAVTTWGADSGGITSTQGGVALQANGTVSGDISGHTQVNVAAWGNISPGAIATNPYLGVGGGGVTVFSSGNMDANVLAGQNASVQAWGNVSGLISAGVGSGSSGGAYVASVSAGGSSGGGYVTGGVSSSGSVVIFATGGVSQGAISAAGGYANIQTAGTMSAKVTAQQNVSILANTLGSAANTITSQLAGVSIQSLADITNVTIDAATAATLFAGTTIENDSITTGGVGSAANQINLTALAGPLAATINAPGDTVDAVSGGNASLTIGPSSGSYADSISVSAQGTLDGTLNATNSVNAFSHGAMGAASELNVNTTAADPSGGVWLFSDAAMNAEVHSAEAVQAGSMSTITGLYYAGLGDGGASAGITAAGNIDNATVNAPGAVTVSSNQSLTADVISAGQGATVSAGQTITGINLDSSNISSITAMGGTAPGQTAPPNNGQIGGTINIDTNNITSPYIENEILAAGDISATITSGGDINVTTFGNFGDSTGSLTATQNASLAATGTVNVDGNVTGGTDSGTVRAGDAAYVSANAISAAVTAGRSATVFSATTITADVTANGGTATASALGSISGNVSGSGGASVYSGVGLTGKVSSSGGDVNVTSGGYISGAMQAGENITVTAIGNISGASTAAGSTSLSTFGNLTGNITAAQNVAASASGYISSTIAATGGSANVSTLGELQSGATVSAGGYADVTAMGSLAGNVTGASVSAASYNGSVTGNITATTGAATVNAADNLQDTITAATAANATAGGTVNVTMNSTGSVSLVALGSAGDTTTASITADGQVTVSSYGVLNITGSDSSGVYGMSITGMNAVTAQIGQGTTNVSSVSIVAGGQLQGSVSTAGGSESVLSAGAMSMALTADTASGQDITATALGGLTGSDISASGLASVLIGGAGGGSGGSGAADSISGGEGVSLTVGGSFDGSLASASGTVTAIIGTNATLTSVTAGQEITLIALGNITTGPGSNAVYAGEDLQIAAGGYLSGNFGSGGNAQLAALGNATPSVNAVGNISVSTLGLLTPMLTAGGDIAMNSYGGVGTSTAGAMVTAGHDITQIMSTGPVYGTFIADHAIGSVQGFDLIDASFNAGNGGSDPADPTFGVVQSVQAWGTISGSITASAAINGVVGGAAISATLTAPHIGTLMGYETGIFGYYPPTPQVSLAAAQAALAQLANAVAGVQAQVAAANSSMAAAVTANQAGLAQTMALVTAENQQAQGEAQAAVTAASQGVNNGLAAANTQSQLLLAQAQAALAAGQQSAVADDAQLDAGLTDAINAADATNAGELANLTAGVAAQQGAVAARTAVQQELVQAQSVALGKANGQRAGNWNAAAGQLFESVGKAIELEVVQTAQQVLQGINTTLNVAMVGEIFGGEELEPITGALRLGTDGLAAGAEALEASEQAALDAAGGSLSAGVPGVAGSFVPAAAADGAATGLAGAAENVAVAVGTAADNAVANGIIRAGEQAGAEAVVNAAPLAVAAWESEGGALAVPTEESAQSIISRVAQEQADRGVQTLNGEMSRGQLKAFQKNPARGSRFLGTVVHNLTANALEDLYPGRFRYYTVGPDFLDTTTGELFDLTTPGQVAAHMAKAGYEALTYALYVLPKL